MLYDDLRVRAIARILSVLVVMVNVRAVPMSLLRKRMRFGRVLYAQLAATVLSCVVAIVLALRGFGVFALVWQQFRRNRFAVVSLVVITLLLIIGTFAPFLANDRPLLVVVDATSAVPLSTHAGQESVERTGWFSPVHMKSRKAHGQRALLSSRKALLNKKWQDQDEEAHQWLLKFTEPGQGYFDKMQTNKFN